MTRSRAGTARLASWLAAACVLTALAGPVAAGATARPSAGSFAPRNHAMTLTELGLVRTLIVHREPDIGWVVHVALPPA